MIRALIFDFDGLILDTETPLIEALVRVHEEAGIAFDRLKVHAIVGHADVAFDPWSAFPAVVDRGELEQAFRRHKDELTAAEAVLPGVLALLDAATARGLRLGVASNSSHVHVDRHLQRLGLLERFQAISCRDDVGLGKPAPDVYRHVMKTLGVSPEETVAFEDSVPGHEAAHAAGIRVVVVPNSSTAHCRFPRAWLQVPSLAGYTLDRLLAALQPADGGTTAP